MNNVLKPLANSVLIALGQTAASSATAAAIHKKSLDRVPVRRPSDLALRMTTLIICNEEMDDIMKIVKLLEESGLLIKDVVKTSKN